MHEAACPLGVSSVYELRRRQVDDRRKARIYVNGGLTLATYDISEPLPCVATGPVIAV